VLGFFKLGCGIKESLGWDTSNVEAGSSERSSTFDTDGLESELSSLDGGNIASGSTSDNGDIVFGGRGEASGKALIGLDFSESEHLWRYIIYRVMLFKVIKETEHGPRSGLLFENVETPALLTHTEAGAIPNLNERNQSDLDFGLV